MRFSPVIHGKTLNQDFRSGLLFAPDDIDVSWARRYILDSTIQIELCYRPRYVVFANSTHLIMGVSAPISTLFSVCGKIGEEDYVADSDNRSLYGFVGWCVHKASVDSCSLSVPGIQDLLHIYRKYIPIRWNETDADGLMAKETYFLSYDETCNSSLQSDIDMNYKLPVYRPGMKYIHSGSDNFDHALYEAVARYALRSDLDISLCTNVPSVGLAARSEFFLSTCDNASESGWRRIESEVSSPQRNQQTLNRDNKISYRERIEAYTPQSESSVASKLIDRASSGVREVMGMLNGTKFYSGGQNDDEFVTIKVGDLDRMLKEYAAQSCRRCKFYCAANCSRRTRQRK